MSTSPALQATFDEYLEYLTDLIDLARHDGYTRVADQLEMQRAHFELHREYFACCVEPAAPPAPPAPR